MSEIEKRGPLHGIRVLDLTSNISGPSATVILADLGAEVIKIERPKQGDDARGMGPYINGESAYFLAINRNKQSVVIDIRQPEGQELIRRLARQVDVMVENFRRGVLEKYGLDAASLSQINPRLIFCSLSAYGEEGPEREKPGYDAVLQARTGMISITGSRPDEPARSGVSVLDMGSGMWSAMAILVALYHRSQTGEGQIVGTSLYETGIYWMNYHLLAFQANGIDPVPQGTSHTAFAPYGAYKTADDLLLIGISNDSLFRRLAKALDHEDWAEDERFVHNHDRLAHRQELDQLLKDCLEKKPCEFWLEQLDRAGVPCSRIQRVSQVMNDPQFQALGMMETAPHTSIGSVRVPRLPIRLEKSPSLIKTGAPMIGEHTEELLLRYGLTAEEIKAYREKGIIG
ncbi:CoA transferase [Microaerobacter geothermalis]|uniref:CaiB/BaiF CoA transferase family protein n=1 Tax=Microaerobacter geothermalis TaxID=674972 RepID=UPI001F45064E|nr:CaiB/BaiF CoA-transferase family protein [Microaerobacter geothermalis]MCF6094027.1 CoA transferase [Microaerobacter geothermalis]